ncbi:gamma-butyrobetaine hydroxylase-like domain-containing protein [Methylobacterium oxalidis]|uniref:Gamma-butyrobetaine hydroxylase-like N-terminal domain-containing protein n=1 Tax=Methylobacterium oxalidis TaxID=944322 RepID=A0A512IWV9_9HYPH|nr:DUF971 domain-containing protein [Methylobacterium oxalidis]GEP02208.1 hypothetical protein MOX02_02460 [Methylobacterium oxalidis]GLS62153.1 hypothetical protein GCM10007888_05340 [Methylobacterium oxalidis]
MSTECWPTEIRLSADRRGLEIGFDDGARFALPAEYLRVHSPSAEVQGHSPAERKVIGGKRNVMILAVEPIGNYAVKLRFDDMHDTGIFGWDYLYALGRDRDARWSTYLAELEAKGLDRDVVRSAAAPATGGSCGSGCGCH